MVVRVLCSIAFIEQCDLDKRFEIPTLNIALYLFLSSQSQGAMYAELGFHDQRPPTSPTGAPLISPTPHDTTVLYAEVQQQQ